MVTRLTLAGLAAATLFAGSGCGLRRKFCRDDCAPRATPSPNGPGIFLDDPLPPRSGGGIPPPNVPTTPGNSLDPLPPPVIPDSRGSFRVDPSTPPGPWEPTPSRSGFRPEPPRSRSGAELLLPESSTRPPASIDIPSGRKSGSPSFLGEPVPPHGSIDRPSSSPSTPPVRTDRPAPNPRPALSAAPVGLPGFQRLVDRNREGVAAGGKPTLDGLDWLQANGYRSVIYLHGTAESSTAARELAEQRDLQFVAITVDAPSLSEAHEKFAHTIDNRASRPVYVADADGSRAAVMWYLLFHKTDYLGRDAARVRAATFGPTEGRSAEEKQLWAAAARL